MHTDDAFARVTVAQLEHSRRLSFCRWLSAQADAVGRQTAVEDVFLGRFPRDLNRHVIEKAAVSGVAGISYNVPSELWAAFISYTHPFTILGRLQTLGARTVPFNVPESESSEPMSNFAWRGLGKPKPIGKHTFSATDALKTLTSSGILVMTRELVRLEGANAEAFMLDELRRAYAAWLDDRFINPAYAAVTDVSPASITNGVSAGSSAGSCEADALSDFRMLLAAYKGMGAKVRTAVILMSSANAVGLSFFDHPAFAQLTREGGRLGVPVIASDTIGDQLIMIDTSGLLIADEGQGDISAGQQASLEMLDSSLVQDGTTGTGAQLVSLWQSNLLGYKIERVLNWTTLANSVAIISGAQYYAAGSPA